MAETPNRPPGGVIPGALRAPRTLTGEPSGSAKGSDATGELQLIARCRSGDDGAFQELVDRYKDFVFALIARTIPDRSRAEDLAQDVFLRVHRGLPYFRGEARLTTWLYRIVSNVCVQEHVRATRHPSSSLPEGSINESGPGGPVMNDLRSTGVGPRAVFDDKRGLTDVSAVDRRFDDLELRDRLEKAIARLAPNYRLLIAAHYLEGVHYETLAEALQVPLGTVKTQLYRAKQQLRRLLETELR
jgi:RNA polymerase sigma-70 factor (ECF subfamily)